MSAHAERQSMPILADADDISALIQALDLALEMREALDRLAPGIGGMHCTSSGPLVTFMADRHKLALYALQLFASSHGLTLREATHPYTHNTSIRHVECFTDRGGSVANVQFPPHRTEVIGDAEGAWSPAHEERQ